MHPTGVIHYIHPCYWIYKKIWQSKLPNCDLLMSIKNFHIWRRHRRAWGVHRYSFIPELQYQRQSSSTFIRASIQAWIGGRQVGPYEHMRARNVLRRGLSIVQIRKRWDHQKSEWDRLHEGRHSFFLPERSISRGCNSVEPNYTWPMYPTGLSK